MRWLGLLAMLFVIGCETMPKPRAASEYLFSTNKGTTTLFSEIKGSFDQHKYKTEKQDNAAGVLLLAPKIFSFQANGRKTFARQYVQMRQEGGSLKLRLSYDCNYTGDQKTFEPCYEDDQALTEKIDRMESAFVEVLKPVLHGENERKTASSHELVDDKPVNPK